MSNGMITIRVNEIEREQIKLLSLFENKTVSQMVKDLVNKELKNKKLTQKEIRNLPKEQRRLILEQLTKESLPYYEKYREELIVEEVFDGIE
jgi:hypothetical protein